MPRDTLAARDILYVWWWCGEFIVTDNGRDRLRRTAQGSVARLEQGRRTGLFVAVTRRFFEIDGLTWGGLMSIELFTTVLPLTILGFSYFSGFADHASLGDVIVRQLELTGSTEPSLSG